MRDELHISAEHVFLGDLNAGVRLSRTLPRVRFESGLPDEAVRWISKKHANGAIHEPATLGAFLAVAKRFPCRMVFDVGALYGYFALFARHVFQSAEVLAFESHPSAFNALVQNVTKLVTSVNVCVSDEIKPNEKIWISGFNIYEEPEGGWENLDKVPGAMKQRGVNNRGRGFSRVNFVTLDAFCEANIIKYAPDFIKIDVEGYQAKAVRGMTGLLAGKRPIVVIELHDPEKLARFGTTNRDTVQPFYDAGYCGYWCGEHRANDATFELVERMEEKHEKLSIMVFVPREKLAGIA